MAFHLGVGVHFFAFGGAVRTAAWLRALHK